MTKILDELRVDHRNMARMLDLLGREMNTFKEGGRPDYDLVEMVIPSSVFGRCEMGNFSRVSGVFRRFLDRAHTGREEIENVH